MDDHYQNRLLVDLYDAVNTSREDFDFYRRQFPNPPCEVLDIGCGTGTFALELAALGYSVTALDPAPEMVAAARAKQGAGAVTWVTGLVSDAPASTPADIAVMTGHAFQCLLQDEDINLLFKSVTARLARDGSFWFETRNAHTRPWNKWTPDHARPAIALADGRTVRVVHTVLAVDGEYVTFEEAYDISGLDRPVTSQSTLRFPPLEQIAQMARANGLRVASSFGDWEGGPLREDSPEIILRLERSR